MLLNAWHSVAVTQRALSTKYCTFCEVKLMSPQFVFFRQLSLSPALRNVFIYVQTEARRLVTGLSNRRPGLEPKPVKVGFVEDKGALETEAL
jgi:hypothetical protein